MSQSQGAQRIEALHGSWLRREVRARFAFTQGHLDTGALAVHVGRVVEGCSWRTVLQQQVELLEKSGSRALPQVSRAWGRCPHCT